MLFDPIVDVVNECVNDIRRIAVVDSSGSGRISGCMNISSVGIHSAHSITEHHQNAQQENSVVGAAEHAMSMH